MTTLAYILAALAVGFLLGHIRASAAHANYQNLGEALVSRVVRASFGAPDYHLMNHVTLRLSDGTTQVDHILVSRYGVFVIETKHYKGWIFANPRQPSWTQVLYHRKYKFQNPIQQNFRHVLAVRQLLDFLEPEAVKSAVIFTGEAEFKTDIPDGVFSLPEFIEYLREQNTEVMSQNRVQFCVGRLETMRLAISGNTDVEHVQSLERRRGNAA